MTADDISELEIMLNRFNRLITDVIRGGSGRNSFLPWELEILIDMEACPLAPRRRLDILRQYQRAVARQMDTGPGPPMKLSQFLEIRAARSAAMHKPSREAPQ
jgi:hypothetical protein